MAKKRDLDQQQQQEQQQKSLMPTDHSHANLPGSGQPSPDEVFASYQQLIQAGFFIKRAIPATRTGLTGRRGAAASNAINPCPSRPPPPPKSTPWTSSTPLSPVAPSPAAASASTTPRGTKRARAPADDGEDAKNVSMDEALSQSTRDIAQIQSNAVSALSSRTSPRKTSKKLRKTPSIRPAAGPDGIVRSLRSMHNAAAQAVPAVSDEATNSRPPTANSHSGSMASSTRLTRSRGTHTPVEVHQALPFVAAPANTATPVAGSRCVVSKKRKQTRRNGSLQSDSGELETTGIRSAATSSVEPHTSLFEEPSRKKRSHGPAAIVYQDSENNGLKNTENFATGEKKAGANGFEDAQLPPETNNHRPLGSSHSAAKFEQSASTCDKTSGRAILTPISPASAQQQQLERQQERQQAPICFHYPQRVRVRRPAQARIVEVKAVSKVSSVVNDHEISHSFRQVDAENVVPVSQD